MKLGVALAALLTATPALAAPMGDGVEAAAVLLLEADPGHDVAAKALTNALRQRVLDSKEFTLNNASPPLVATAYDAKCPLKAMKRPMVATNDRAFDAACLRRVGAQVDARRFFWGFLYVADGAPVVRLHFWQEGHDRVAELPYDATQRDRLADRLYKKLVTPTAVGDLRLSGGPAGELLVDGKPAGTYAAGAELTLETGEHLLEVRDGPRVLARGRGRVEPGGRSEATMMPVAEPAPTPSATQAPYHDPPSITVRSKASAWPWVLGGVGGAGLVGAGIFWGLRSGERSDLEQACMGKACPPGQDITTGRVNTYATLSAVSLGVGVAAGAGLVTYLVVARREPKTVVGFAPVAGGAALRVGGQF